MPLHTQLVHVTVLYTASVGGDTASVGGNTPTAEAAHDMSL